MTLQTKTYKGEYNGAAFQAVVNGISMRFVLTKLLRDHGLESIDPNKWYDLQLAHSLYASIAKRVGEGTLTRIGIEMIDVAEFPPGMEEPHSALAGICMGYHMNVRGEEIGSVGYEALGERTAKIVSDTPFPCALERGMLRGCCEKFGVDPTIEHMSATCRATGGMTCEYRVAW